MPRCVPKAIIFIFFLIFPLYILLAIDTTYQIQQGDTLYSISRTYNIDHRMLMKANDISNERSLRIGQVLIIPHDPSNPLESYEIQGGDTIYSISQRIGITVNEILDFNRLSKDDIIKPGQILQLRSSDEISLTSSDSADSVGGANAHTHEHMFSSYAENFWPHDGKRFALDGKLPGVAIRGKAGDDIRAVSNGRVVYSGPHSTLANVVFIQNPAGYIYIYGGNSTLHVNSGDEIYSGQIIGDLGPSPLLPEAQVYFSVWKEGKYINPSQSPR